MTLQQLFAMLYAEGRVAQVEAPVLAPMAPDNPWYTRVLMGFMGWLGGLLVLGFFGALVAMLFQNTAGMLTLSVILFAASAAIYRAAPNNDFATQFALAASIAGQVLAALAIGRALGSHFSANTTLFVLIGVMQLALALLMPNFLHRLLSILFAVLAFAMAAYRTENLALVEATVAILLVSIAMLESRLVAAGMGEQVEPVLCGLAIAVLAIGGAHSVSIGLTRWLPSLTLSSAVFALALVLWAGWCARTAAATTRAAAIGAAAAFVLVTWKAPGLAPAVLVALIAFAGGRRALTALALVALVACLSSYYYQMQLTLAQKSLVLAAAGAVLLLFWWGQRTWFSVEAQ